MRFNGEGIYNILYMANVTKKLPVSYASADGDRFILQKTDSQLVFNRSPSGLYYHGVGDRDILMVSTITGNREGYTDREFASETEAREGLDMMGNPPHIDYINMVCSGMLHNCPITPDLMNNANYIFGANFPSLKGKTTRKSYNTVVTEYVEVPQVILDLNKR